MYVLIIMTKQNREQQKRHVQIMFLLLYAEILYKIIKLNERDGGINGCPEIMKHEENDK